MTGGPIVDVILDRAGQKGTGQWTINAALEQGIPVDTMSEAVFARCISAIKEERAAASKQIGGPAKATFDGDKALLSGSAIHFTHRKFVPTLRVLPSCVPWVKSLAGSLISAKSR